MHRYLFASAHHSVRWFIPSLLVWTKIHFSFGFGLSSSQSFHCFAKQLRIAKLRTPPLFLAVDVLVVVPRTEIYCDLMFADHKVLREESESRNNHRYAVVLQDLATQWLQSYTCKTKTSQETQKSLMKFQEPTTKRKVIYTDNSQEFRKLLKSGLDKEWWACSVKCYCYLRNIQEFVCYVYTMRGGSGNHFTD